MKRFAACALLFGLLTGQAWAAQSIVVSDAWSRPAIDTGVVYVHVANGGWLADQLIGARSPVARAVELHRSMEMSGSMNGVAMSGVSSMKPVRVLLVRAHGTLALAPGGAHIMLIGLRHDLRAGERFPVQLHFARAGWITTTVAVRPI